MPTEPKSFLPEPDSDCSGTACSSALWHGLRASLSRLSVMGARFEESSKQSALDAYIGGIGLTRLTVEKDNTSNDVTLSAQRLDPAILWNSADSTSSTARDIISRK